MAALKIDRLALHLPGIGADDARGLAARLADRLAAAPVRGASRRIETLRVTVRLDADAPGGGLAGRIADELLRQLEREGA